MNNDGPQGYEREFTTVINRRSQIRIGLSTEKADVMRFFVQLEYWRDGGWMEVVRFAHNPNTEFGHDITEDGLHMDIYRDGEKYHVREDFPAVKLNCAPTLLYGIYPRARGSHTQEIQEWHNVNANDR
ncbi:hypothetical protein [Haloquadratum walsbyi]|jgi:hypothetical protein|uniref:DUF7718 domain-containing protein n=1 Tax=Haloquadratum walsbyi J07HQW2 TaxID=1238425 RepID=U1NCY0_9EURY|nr:hypothetical protein [Haloquadratum walsbyi]ERG94795.1 MAG: hypothetical protein J07HQW2_01237 [Haloquadratum walsbyi J07HQW2]